MSTKPKNKNEGIGSAQDLATLSPEKQKKALAQLISEASDAEGISSSQMSHLKFRDFLKDQFGIGDAARIMTMIQQLGGMTAMLASYFPKQITPLMVERVELLETQKVNRRYENDEVCNEYFIKRLKEAVREAYAKYPITVRKFNGPKTPQSSDDTPRELNVVLSDLHLQSLIKKAETGTEYGAVQEARRLASIGQQVANYKLDHRASTDLNVLLLGDIIQNHLHDPRDGSTMAEQFQAAVYLLIQLLGYWSTAFKKVTVYCATGNHGRNTSRHQKRAVFEKWDSVETQIYYAIMVAMAHSFPTIKFIIPQTPWVEYETCGYPVFATHGDTVLNVGNPGKTVDVQRLENQVNKANESRISKKKNPFRVFVAGHVHRALNVYLDSGTTVLINGPLCPPDGFATSLGIYSGQCGMWLWESTKDFVIGDTRLMRVGEIQDQDESLDLIIRPYTTFAPAPKVKVFIKKKR